MKTVITIALLFFATLLAFGQQATAPLTKTPEQFNRETKEYSNRLLADTMEMYAGFFLERTGRFQVLARERARLYHKLELALADCDPVLVQKAAENINFNALRIKMSTRGLKEMAGELQQRIASAFADDAIDEARYLEIRNFIRATIAEADKKQPAEFDGLLAKAKAIIPNYFAMLERNPE